jgi:hypothetical protein
MFQSHSSSVETRPAPTRVRSISFAAARIAPWVIFGPITGIMSEAALAAFRRGRPVLAGVYVALNVAILLGMPLATAMLMAGVKTPL